MASRIGLDQRTGFLGLTEEDRRCLAGLRPVLEKHSERLVLAFYRRLLEFEPTRTLLADPGMRERLIDKQRRYLLSLAGPRMDDAWVEERKQIGRAHAQAGLEVAWYLGAYVLYMRLLMPAIREAHAGDTARADRAISALVKILMLDAQLGIEGYLERRQLDLEQLNRELAAASSALREDYEAQGIQLRGAVERARAAEEVASVASIVAGLAHQIGTPMGVIQGYAEALEGSVRDEAGIARLRAIREQIDRIADVMRTLLSVAEPQDRGWASVDLRTVLERCLSVLTERFSGDGIQVNPSLRGTAVLRGNSDRLQQLFLNLFLNAAEAMPRGGILEVELLRSKGDSVGVHIRDSGHGIPESDLGRIFEPFFTTKPAGEGSGLGLMVAQRIARDHGGTIEVRSSPGKGTELQVRLPCEPLRGRR